MPELPAAPPELPAVVAPEHFRNGRFFNPGAPPHGFQQFLKWIAARKVGPWRTWIPSTPGPRPPVSIEGEAMHLTFINHSSVLLQTHRLNILTDPVWSERVSPVSFAGPRRHRAPGIRLEDLPPIHCILISHNHYDHLDVPTLRRLREAQSPAVFCPLGVAKLLRKAGFSEIHELDWWQSLPFGGIRLHCVPAQHFSSRTPFDRNRTLWCGWVLETAGGNTYFAADTGFGDFFGAIRDRFAPIRLALLPIGSYEPEWFMGPIHMTPEEAVEAQSILQAAVVVPIHYGTFSLADDSETAPLDRLRQALQHRSDAHRFWVVAEGEGRAIP
jgi:L-ascorbate metabolism protein UlaG (beta-lactamase superfamily)